MDGGFTAGQRMTRPRLRYDEAHNIDNAVHDGLLRFLTLQNTYVTSWFLSQRRSLETSASHAFFHNRVPKPNYFPDQQGQIAAPRSVIVYRDPQAMSAVNCRIR